jgi:hypothetical protein
VSDCLTSAILGYAGVVLDTEELLRLFPGMLWGGRNRSCCRNTNK